MPTWLFLLLGSVASCGGKGATALGDGTTGPFEAHGNNSPGDGDTPAPPALTQRQFDAAVIGATDRPDGVDTTGGAWRIIDAPGLDGPAIVHSPAGWFSLSRGSAGSKVISGAQSALYRSTDGVHWTSVALAQDNDLMMRWLTYGAGHYVMSGSRFGERGGDVLWTSSDGEHWREQAQPPVRGYWSTLAYAENRFFRFGFNVVGVSEAGESWAVVPISMVQDGGAAYGNGLYLLSGNGDMQTSRDGLNWQAQPVDCALPGACITTPSGEVGQTFHAAPIFAEGRFYAGQLSSADGVSWRAESRPAVAAYVSGHFLSSPSVVGGLGAWVTGGETQTLRVIDPSREAASNPERPIAGYHQLELGPLPDQVSVEFDDGLTCETAACVSVGDLLLLVPPPGTPPLVDRVPRGADGAPLLSRDCPVSSMIFCDDYATRTGCVCHPEAPRAPVYCDDVSQYRCAGQFIANGVEWPLEELGLAGCDCNGVDPNQPAGFGTTCSAEASVCQAPLACLQIDYPPSEGPPIPRSICTSACSVDADCPSWQATGVCSGAVHLRCSNGSCQPRSCD